MFLWVKLKKSLGHIKLWNKQIKRKTLHEFYTRTSDPIGTSDKDAIYNKESIKGVLYPRSVFGLFLHFSHKLQHIGNK